MYYEDMKKPKKFTIPRSLFDEIKRRSALYSLTASGFVEVAIEYLREAENPKELVLAQEDSTNDMMGACYAISESDFAFIKNLCGDTGVTKRIVIMAAVALFSQKFQAPSES